MSEEESSQTMDTEDHASTTSTDEYESPITTDNETDNEEEENDPWMPMVEEAMQKHKAAFEEIKMNLIYNGQDEKSTKNNFVDNDDFDPEEAMEAAVEKRKFLIKRLLKDYSFTEDMQR